MVQSGVLPVLVRVVCPASSRTPVTSAVVARASSSRFIQSLPVSQTELTVPTVSMDLRFPTQLVFPVRNGTEQV